MSKTRCETLALFRFEEPKSPKVSRLVLLMDPYESLHKWHLIPQRPYGQKQWDYKPVEPILFQVNGHPGVNMGAALRKEFTNLEGRDDLVLQDVGEVISCSLFVRSSCRLDSTLRIADVLASSSVGTRRINRSR